MKFAYAAFDKSGKLVQGQLEASDVSVARETLRRQGLFASEIRQAGESDVSDSTRRAAGMGRGRRLKNLALFSRQMHVLLASGTPIVQALGAIERQARHQGWRAVVQTLRKYVEEGQPLSQAMRQQPQHFDAVSCSLVAAGESSGNLPLMLERLAALSRKQLHLRSMVLSAMVYPCLLITVGVGVLALLLVFVLPRFATLFENLDAPLPPATRALLWISDTLGVWWWAAAITLGGGGAAVRIWLNSPTGRRSMDRLLLNLPRIGLIVRNLMTARLARMLGTLLDSRVPLLQSLQLTRESAANSCYADLLSRAEQAVSRGEPISAVLCESDLISACVQEAIRNGETTGQIGTPLLQMADFLDEEADLVIKALTSIIEPVILIFLGLVVGFIAISMFLPLFDLVSAARGG